MDEATVTSVLHFVSCSDRSDTDEFALLFVDANLPQTGSRYYRLVQTRGD